MLLRELVRFLRFFARAFPRATGLLAFLLLRHLHRLIAKFITNYITYNNLSVNSNAYYSSQIPSSKGRSQLLLQSKQPSIENNSSSIPNSTNTMPAKEASSSSTGESQPFSVALAPFCGTASSPPPHHRPHTHASASASRLEGLHDELMYSVMTFLRGAELTAVMRTSRTCRNMALTPWIWSESLRQEFSDLGPLYPRPRPTLVYPAEAVLAHNIQARERGVAAAASTTREQEEENMLRFRRGEEEPASAPEYQLPFEGVQMVSGDLPFANENAADEPDSSSSSPSPSSSSSPHSSSDVKELIRSYANLHAISRGLTFRFYERASRISRSSVPPADADAFVTASTSDNPRNSSTSATEPNEGWRPMHPTEGQTMVALPNLLVCLAGFARFGPNVGIWVRRTDQLLAGWVQAERAPRNGAPLLEGRPEDSPRHGVYGGISTAIDDKHVLLVSGYRNGGYSGESRRVFLLQVDQNPAETGKREGAEESKASENSSEPVKPSMRLRWLPLPYSARMLPQPHCYGSINFHAPSRRVFAFGGGAEEGPTNALSVLALDTMQWTNVETSGQGPTPMLSHVAGIIGNQLWVLGGSNGSDPPRSGTDLQDVYYLDLDTMEWHFVTLRIKGPRPKLCRKLQGHVVGHRIFLLGIDMHNEKGADPQEREERERQRRAHRNERRERKKERQARRAAKGAKRKSSSEECEAEATATSSSSAPAGSTNISLSTASAKAGQTTNSSSTTGINAATASSKSTDSPLKKQKVDQPSLSGSEEDSDGASSPNDDDRRRLRQTVGDFYQNTMQITAEHAAGVVILDTERLEWLWPVIRKPDRSGTRSASSRPAHLQDAPVWPRFASSSAVCGDSIYLFAGCITRGPTRGDLWSLKLNEGLVPPEGGAASATSAASSASSSTTASVSSSTDSAVSAFAHLSALERHEEALVLRHRDAQRARSTLPGGPPSVEVDIDDSYANERAETGGMAEMDLEDYLQLYFQLRHGGRWAGGHDAQAAPDEEADRDPAEVFEENAAADAATMMLRQLIGLTGGRSAMGGQLPFVFDSRGRMEFEIQPDDDYEEGEDMEEEEEENLDNVDVYTGHDEDELGQSMSESDDGDDPGLEEASA